VNAVGLFAGIGGIELGFARAGIESELLCEIDEPASIVLKKTFSDVPISRDVRELRSLPRIDVLAAGFPCQNLSLVGDKTGINGAQSGLINEVFRLVARRKAWPTWVVLENVPFMLWHKKGHAIRYVTSSLEQLGFNWAYRIVDTRSFGLPQRRRRVILVASRTEDPRLVLFSDDEQFEEPKDDGAVPCGFSWTEGRAGLGWAPNCIPTLKAGSGVGIPSPPAIWDRDKARIVTPNIIDAERLQGFDAGITDIQVDGKRVRPGVRWRLVGNAVSVPVAEWLGKRLLDPGASFDSSAMAEWTGGTWPNAASGTTKGNKFKHLVSEAPEAHDFIGLGDFLQHPCKDLSPRAARGFLRRAKSGSLRFAAGFLEAVEHHAKLVEQEQDELAM
jgi:DNA (cytosine-5)-methyltransferase 1